MFIPHGTTIVVLDGSGLKLYRNGGEETHPKLAPLPVPALTAHSHDSGKQHRSSAANPDRQNAGEDSFFAAVAEWLNGQAAEGKIQHLVVVAPPRALGELRRHYHKALAEKVLLELHKDLMDRPLAELEAALVHAKAL